ncbi:MAG: ABC transporter ATP-binding protein [Methanocorpusculum sp.]|nr:ABC transporter ATP-binding protein [Methanocorpusculum sp.]
MAGMRHGGKGFKGGAKPKHAGKTIKRILSYMTGPYKAILVAVFICIILSSVTGVIGSMFIEVLIDDYVVPLVGSINPDFSGLVKAILVMAGIYLMGVLATFIYTRVIVTVAEGVLRNVRNEMFSKMQGLPIKYFDTHKFGDTMSRYTNDTDTLRQMISQSVPQMFSSVITIVAVFSAMLYTSFYLTLIVIAMIVLMFYVTKIVGGKSAKYFIAQQKSLGSLDGYIEEMINGQKVIKVFCHEEKAKAGFDKANDELCGNATKANTFANIFMPIMANIGNIQFVLIAIAGGALAIFNIGGLTLGAIAAFLNLSKSFSMPVSQVSQQINSVIMALAGAERIFELMDELPENDDGCVTLVHAKDENGTLSESDTYTGVFAWKKSTTEDISYTKLTGDVWFDNVDFSYVEGHEVLHDISLYAKPGQKVALVGATGAGKTTITNLINRFYDISDGKIFYDGIDIKEIRKSDLRHSLGVVLQDVNLFSGTIRENIRYGKLDATDDEIVEAAKLANADDFISRLPEGYDTVIDGNGESLSQGQRQLLSIARAAVANPPVMILDEATSSIDTRTEALVQKGMDSLMKGRTVFVIAHRLSTVKNSDAIMVMDNGRIIERGSHEKLIEKRGRYYQLYTGAFELE